MFCNYKIINSVLYLYIDDKCEIGSLFNNSKNEKIIDKIRIYIKKHKIKFDGTKVILLLGSLMLGTVYLNNEFKKENYMVNKDYKYAYNLADKRITNLNLKEKNKQKIITLVRKNKEVIKLGINEYLIGVVSAQIPATFNIEAIKAQAIIARTYTLKLLENNITLTDDISTQVYKNNIELKKIWGNNYDTYYQKIKKAVIDTDGVCIKYNDSLINAIYHSTSNGYTEDSLNVWKKDIPYLKTVTSLWDTSASSYLKDTKLNFDKISNILGINFDSTSRIEITSRNESNRIAKINFNDNEYSGIEIRNLLGLRSTDFDFSIIEDGVVFTTRGYGHGVGMSQYGANAMAMAGYNYKEILKYYYQGIQIVKIY